MNKFKKCDIGKCRHASMLNGLIDGEYTHVFCEYLCGGKDYNKIAHIEYTPEEQGMIKRNDNCPHFAPDNKLYLYDVEIEPCEYELTYKCPLCGQINYENVSTPYFNNFEFECGGCGDTVAINTDD